MNKECKLCNGKYDFRKVQVREILGTAEIVFVGNLMQTNNQNAFRYCPLCGRELTNDNFACNEI